MSTEQTVVIVGASLAGAKAAETLHHEGFDGRVVMVGEEAERPYERPPLSQDLTGQAARPPSCELGPLSRSRQTDTPPPCGNVVPVDSPGNEAGEDRQEDRVDGCGRLNPRQGDLTRKESHTTPAASGVAGMILLLGVGAAYLLMRASPAVATIAGVLITTGLLGLVILTRVVAAHSSGPRRDDGVGPGHARPELILVRPNVDTEMELYRILDDDRFGNISTGRAANTHDRRRRAV